MWADEDAVQPGRLAFGFRLEVEPDVTHETQEMGRILACRADR
jgi:hypothetical protein